MTIAFHITSHILDIMYKLSGPFDSQTLESFESRVLASETKFEYSRAAGRNAYSL